MIQRNIEWTPKLNGIYRNGKNVATQVLAVEIFNDGTKGIMEIHKEMLHKYQIKICSKVGHPLYNKKIKLIYDIKLVGTVGHDDMSIRYKSLKYDRSVNFMTYQLQYFHPDMTANNWNAIKCGFGNSGMKNALVKQDIYDTVAQLGGTLTEIHVKDKTISDNDDDVHLILRCKQTSASDWPGMNEVDTRSLGITSGYPTAKLIAKIKGSWHFLTTKDYKNWELFINVKIPNISIFPNFKHPNPSFPNVISDDEWNQFETVSCVDINDEFIEGLNDINDDNDIASIISNENDNTSIISNEKKKPSKKDDKREIDDDTTDDETVHLDLPSIGPFDGEDIAVETNKDIAVETNEDIVVEINKDIAVETNKDIAVETNKDIVVEINKDIAVEGANNQNQTCTNEMNTQLIDIESKEGNWEDEFLHTGSDSHTKLATHHTNSCIFDKMDLKHKTGLNPLGDLNIADPDADADITDITTWPKSHGDNWYTITTHQVAEYFGKLVEDMVETGVKRYNLKEEHIPMLTEQVCQEIKCPIKGCTNIIYTGIPGHEPWHSAQHPQKSCVKELTAHLIDMGLKESTILNALQSTFNINTLTNQISKEWKQDIPADKPAKFRKLHLTGHLSKKMKNLYWKYHHRCEQDRYNEIYYNLYDKDTLYIPSNVYDNLLKCIQSKHEFESTGYGCYVPIKFVIKKSQQLQPYILIEFIKQHLDSNNFMLYQQHPQNIVDDYHQLNNPFDPDCQVDLTNEVENITKQPFRKIQTNNDTLNIIGGNSSKTIKIQKLANDKNTFDFYKDTMKMAAMYTCYRDWFEYISYMKIKYITTKDPTIGNAIFGRRFQLTRRIMFMYCHGYAEWMLGFYPPYECWFGNVCAWIHHNVFDGRKGGDSQTIEYNGYEWKKAFRMFSNRHPDANLNIGVDVSTKDEFMHFREIIDYYKVFLNGIYDQINDIDGWHHELTPKHMAELLPDYGLTTQYHIQIMKHVVKNEIKPNDCFEYAQNVQRTEDLKLNSQIAKEFHELVQQEKVNSQTIVVDEDDDDKTVRSDSQSSSSSNSSSNSSSAGVVERNDATRSERQNEVL